MDECLCYTRRRYFTRINCCFCFCTQPSILFIWMETPAADDYLFVSYVLCARQEKTIDYSNQISRIVLYYRCCGEHVCNIARLRCDYVPYLVTASVSVYARYQMTFSVYVRFERYHNAFEQLISCIMHCVVSCAHLRTLSRIDIPCALRLMVFTCICSV